MRNFSLFTFSLYAFMQFLRLYHVNMHILTSYFYERTYYHELESFSFVESHAIQKTVKHFNDYKSDPITFETKLGFVHIVFFDEVAYLHYAFEKEVYAKLEYDLVYDSALAYNIIPEAMFPSVDKIIH